MSGLNAAILQMDADVDGDGTKETGEFHLVGNLEINESIRTGYLVSGRGSSVNSITSSLVADGEANRRGFHLDLGGGAHVIEVSFTGWRGAKYENADGQRVNAQWGNTNDETTLTVGDATGEDPLTQMQIFMNYLRTGEIDSRAPASLQFGQYNPDGVLADSLDVVVEGPQTTHTAQDHSTFDGTMTLIETESLSNVIDAQKREDW